MVSPAREQKTPSHDGPIQRPDPASAAPAGPTHPVPHAATGGPVHDFGRISILPGAPAERRTSGRRGSASEEEADRVSGLVMRGAPGARPAVHARATGEGRSNAQPLPSSVSDVLGSPGRPLGPQVRGFMEPRFGRDFSRVRVHSGDRAAQSARAVNALAYTVGHHVVFGAGRYQPAAGDGRRLLAHELTHVVQQEQAGVAALQRFEPEDAAVEMIGKSFTLNQAVTTSGVTIPKGGKVVITAWTNTSTTVTANFTSGAKVVSVTLEKSVLVPVGDTASGLYQYKAGVAGTQKKYAKIEKQIKEKEKAVADWKAEEKNYTTAKGKAEWARQMKLKEEELGDARYKLTGAGYTAATLPERLKTKVGTRTIPITPQSTLLNRALIEETMFNAFDASVVKWVKHYNSTIGKAKGWSALDANLVKSMLYQESHMGTRGDFLLPPPYSKGQRMTRFNIGQAIDSSGPQQILMIKEISPAIATKHSLDQVPKDMAAAQARRKVLVGKGTAITAPEQAELDEINRRTNSGTRWNDYFTTDTRWVAAVEEFFTETVKARNLDYDYWIRTAVRWLFLKRESVGDWEAAIKAYNGSGADATKYKKDVIGRRDAAKTAAAGSKDFIPKQHY